MTPSRPAGSGTKGQEEQRPPRAHPERDAPEKPPRKAKKNRRSPKKSGGAGRAATPATTASSADRVKITELVSTPGTAERSDPAEPFTGPRPPAGARPDGTAPDAAPDDARADDATSDDTRADDAAAEDPPLDAGPEEPAERSAMHAFDLLYVRHAGPVGQQCYLLCGDRDLAARAVAHAFRLAWERWPEVAVDRDPPSWIRAAAYEYALSPWHRLRRPAHRRPKVRGGTAENQQLLDALLALPPSYRRSLVLHDALGLGLPDTAAEAEATTAATAARITRAHESLAERVPRLAEVPPEQRGKLLGSLLEELTGTQPIRPLPATRARLHSERATRHQLAAALALVALLVSAVAVSLLMNG